MLKIKITDGGQKEIARLKGSIEESLQQILEFVPREDLIGLSYICLTDIPWRRGNDLASACGAYFQTSQNADAYIEIYLSAIFGHIKRAESFQLMVPIQMVGLAQTVFHEIGHHVERTRIHGIKRKKRERFAENYQRRIMAKYLDANANAIKSCFETLKKIANERGLSHEVLAKMKGGWESQYRLLVSNELPDQKCSL